MSSSYGLKGNLQYHSCFFYAAESEDFIMKLTYHRNGDYLLPDLGLTEAEQRPLGKYGRMRLRYLEEHRPGLYTRLLLSGKLMEHLQEIDSTCQERLEQLTRQMQAQEGVTEELKAENQMEWVQRMNTIHHQIEGILLTELILA